MLRRESGVHAKDTQAPRERRDPTTLPATSLELTQGETAPPKRKQAHGGAGLEAGAPVHIYGDGKKPGENGLQEGRHL